MKAYPINTDGEKSGKIRDFSNEQWEKMNRDFKNLRWKKYEREGRRETGGSVKKNA